MANFADRLGVPNLDYDEFLASENIFVAHPGILISERSNIHIVGGTSNKRLS
jgi:hypothetical protein